MDNAALEYAINHIFLPPKLPQEDDSADMKLQRALLQHIAKCAKSFCEGLERDNAGIEVQDCWKLVYRTLKHFAALHSTPNLSRETLEEVISGMQVHGESILHEFIANLG